MIKTRYSWLWIIFMIAMTLWYAWPQIFYSMFILYDVIRTFFPHLLPYLDLFAQSINLGGEYSTWWFR